MMPSATGAPAKFDFPVLDGDGHVAEPHDLWARYCDAAHRDAAQAALRIADLPEGGSALMLEGRCLVRGIEAVTFAGQNPRAFRGRRWDEGYPGAFDPAHRLRDMRGGHRLIRTPPGEILARQCFVSVEGDERSLPALVDLIGEDVLFWASDFPHFDGHFPGAVTEAVEGLASLPDRVTRKVLGENAARMFGVTL